MACPAHNFIKTLYLAPLLQVKPKGMTRPSIHSTENFVYKHVDIYFLAGWQARALERMENGNLPVWSPL